MVEAMSNYSVPTEFRKMKLFINNDWVDSSEGETFTSECPEKNILSSYDGTIKDDVIIVAENAIQFI